MFGHNMTVPTAVMYEISWEEYVEPTPSEIKKLIKYNKTNLDTIRK